MAYKLGSKKNEGMTSLEKKGLIGTTPPADKPTARDIDFKNKKKAAELVFTTRLRESGLSLADFKKTKEGNKLAIDVQTVASQAQGF